MAGDPRKPPADDVRNPEAPEAVNREQRDDDAQAQTVAEAARHGRRLEDSKKPPGRDERDDVQDLVDHMRHMERSGRLDMDAYRSEEHTSELQSLMRISTAV